MTGWGTIFNAVHFHVSQWKTYQTYILGYIFTNDFFKGVLLFLKFQLTLIFPQIFLCVLNAFYRSYQMIINLGMVDEVNDIMKAQILYTDPILLLS